MFSKNRGDKKLVKRMLAGEEVAFNEFFDQFFPRLFRFALTRVGGDREIAEEVAQSTLCAMIDKLDTYRGEAALFTWACTFCRHEISAFFKKNRHLEKESSLVEDTPEIRAALESLSAENGYDDEARNREISRLVQVTLDHLSPAYAEVLVAKYIHGFSVRQIAESSATTEKAVESLLTRARQAFRDGFSSLAGGVGI